MSKGHIGIRSIGHSFTRIKHRTATVVKSGFGEAELPYQTLSEPDA